MLQNLAKEIIISLADILNVQQVRREVVERALKLICDGFSFECGLVYEISLTNRFCLMQQYGLGAHPAKEQVDVDFLQAEDQAYLAQKLMTVMERNAQNTPLEKRLLDLYTAQSLILSPVTDENHHVYGFLILFARSRKHVLNEIDLPSVSIALSMLLRYVGISLYEKKFAKMLVTLESVLDNAGVDIYVSDFYHHEILYTNESMAAPYGGKEKFLGQKCWQVLYPGQSGPCAFCPQKHLIDENGMPTKVYSWDYQRSLDGLWFRVFSAAFYWVDGRLAHIVSSADITENKKNEMLIENLANFDQLTQLPNRRSLIKECERRISQATEDEKGYLLFFDIDGFKAINDRFGHDAGDEFLIQLGAFFREIPPLKNAIYRNGGDEFVAIVSGTAISKNHIRQLANLIHERFKKVWKLKKGEVMCGVSIGVACYPDDGITAQELLYKADKAMYQVKNTGGGGLCFGNQLSE